MQLSKWTETNFDLLIKILRQALRIGTFFDWSSIILNNLHLEFAYVFGVGPIKRKVPIANSGNISCFVICSRANDYLYYNVDYLKGADLIMDNEHANSIQRNPFTSPLSS